jgi:hypothetical protein
VSSEWPVCPVGETAAPHRMGAALTYARRYALFTLVGIAGEDDLDAPDLPMLKQNGGTASSAATEMNGGVAAPHHSMVAAENRSSRRSPSRPAKLVLDAEASASWRDQLLSEITNLGSADAMIAWAQHSLALKNTLTAPDARLVEEAFANKIRSFDGADAPPERSAAVNGDVRPDGVSDPKFNADGSTRAGTFGDDITVAPAPVIDSLSPEQQHEPDLRAVAVATADGTKNNAGPAQHSNAVVRGARPVPQRTRRVRNKEHLDFVASLPCLVCGRQPCDPHHLRFVQPRALGRKVSDEFTVPLCRIHHRELHRQTSEEAWWSLVNIDPKAAALRLWQQTRGLLIPAVVSQEIQKDGTAPQ